MIRSVNNSLSNTQIAYKGSHTRTSDGTPYYKTNSAMKIGGSIAAFDVATILLFAPKTITKNILSIAYPIIAHIGSALFIDHMRNKESAKVAEEIRSKGLRSAIHKNDKIMLSRNGRGYYESNTGAKHGTWLGATCGLINTLNPKLYTPQSSKALKIFSTIAGIGFSALGGHLLGKWSDNIANKDARRNA